METPGQQCARLVAALEDLAQQEAACVRMSDFNAIVQLQGRAAPIVAHLAAQGPAAADSVVRQRLSAVIRLREETAAEIQSQVEHTRQRLDALRVSQRRAAQLAPAYGRAKSRSQLRAVG